MSSKVKLAVIVIGCGLVLALFSVLIFLTTVDAGETCAVTTFGQVTGWAGPGPHWRVPGIHSYHRFSSREAVYETSDHPEESDADYTDYTVNAQTKDGQQIGVKFGARFHIDPQNTIKVYRDIAQTTKDVVERVVKFHSRSVVRLTAQEYEAETLYSGDVFQVESKIEERLGPLFDEQGVTIDSFVLRKIEFDPDYIQAIENQQIAQENILTAQFNAEAAVHKANETKELARGEADAAIERARGDAQAMLTKAEKEAEAIKLRGEALREYPEVLQLNFIEKLEKVTWGFLPSEGIVPFLPIGPSGVITGAITATP